MGFLAVPSGDPYLCPWDYRRLSHEMTDQLDRLKAALADRYRIERQLGVGGMATVYLAET